MSAVLLALVCVRTSGVARESSTLLISPIPAENESMSSASLAERRTSVWYFVASEDVSITSGNRQLVPASWIGRSRQSTTVRGGKILALVGNSLTGYSQPTEVRSDAESPLRTLLNSSEDAPALDPLTGSVLFVPTPRYVAATLQAARALLDDSNVAGLVFWVPRVAPAAMDSDRIGEVTGLLGEGDRSQHESPQGIAYRATQRAVDRMAASVADWGRGAGGAGPEFWLATFSWPLLLASGQVAPFFALAEVEAVTGFVVLVASLSSEAISLSGIPELLRPTDFEWTLFQVLFAAALGEQGQRPVVLAPFLGEGDTTSVLAHTAIATLLTDPTRYGVAFDLERVIAEDAGEEQGSRDCAELAAMRASIKNLWRFDLAKRSVRWQTSTRNVAVLFSDTALMTSMSESTSDKLARIFTLWLPFARAGIPPTILSFAGLSQAEPSRKTVFGITSFAFQCPRKQELVALAQWLREGGILLLFDAATTSRGLKLGTPATAGSGDGSRECQAQKEFFDLVGLPREIVPGTYRVQEGWLFYYADSPNALTRNLEKQGALVDQLRAAAEITGAPLDIKPYSVVTVGHITAGWMAPACPSNGFLLVGDYIDMLNPELRVVRSPRFGPNHIFLLKRLGSMPASSRARVEASTADIAGWRTSEDGTLHVDFSGEPRNGSRFLWLSSSRPPRWVEESSRDTAIGMGYEWDASRNLIEIEICEEARSVVVGW